MMRPEVLPLAVNLILLVVYTYQWSEPGKIFYWLGATLLTVGILIMRG